MSAVEYKNKGNEALQKKDFNTAIDLYTKGIELDAQNEVLYANRCAAQLAMNNFVNALQDAEKAIEIKPTWSRGFFRKGQALHGLNRLNEAKAALQRALQIEPENQQILKALGDVETALAQSRSTGISAETLMKAMKNPKIQKYFEDPDFTQKLQLLQSNPQLGAALGQDPRIAEFYAELMKASSGEEDEVMEEPQAQPSQSAPREEPKQEAPKPAPAEEKKEEPKKESVNPAAEEEKQKGNSFYTKKQFEEALVHYNKAVELDPNNIVYRLNRAAVYLETNKIQECIKECEEAITIGKSVKADYQQIAKAYARMGNAYFKNQQYDEAIKQYTESVTEHRTRETVEKLNKAQQLKRQKEEQAYLNPEKAEEAKNAGNEAFKKQDYPTAVQHYRDAIKRNPNNHLYYSNLAAAYTKLGELMYALKNYEKSIELDPNFVKGYKGKATCHKLMKEYHKALEAFDLGLKIEPNNQELLEGRQQVMMLISTQQPDEERLRRAKSDPEIIAILQDPIMQTVLNDLKENPQAAMKHFMNPEVKAKIEKLVAAGILQMR